jgi:hypothetical protein
MNRKDGVPAASSFVVSPAACAPTAPSRRASGSAAIVIIAAAGVKTFEQLAPKPWTLLPEGQHCD